MKLAMLAKALPIVTALHLVEHRIGANVGAGDQLAARVEVDAPRIASSFGKQFELPSTWMVAPDALLEGGPANVGGHGAALSAVQPAIGPPSERIGDGVGGFHAEAFEQDLGTAVGLVVAVAIGVEEQVRGLNDEHPAVTDRQTAGQIESFDKILRGVRASVVVVVFEDRD